MPFALRNRLSSPQIVQPHDQPPLIWQALGDPSGEDLREIPDDLRNDISLMRAVRLGNLELIEDAEKIDEAYDRMRSHGQQTADAAAQALQGTIQKQDTARAMIGTQCIAAGPRQGLRCENQVIMLASEQGTRPPLCSEHHTDAGRYVFVKGSDGQPDGWAKVTS